MGKNTEYETKSINAQGAPGRRRLERHIKEGWVIVDRKQGSWLSPNENVILQRARSLSQRIDEAITMPSYPSASEARQAAGKPKVERDWRGIELPNPWATDLKAERQAYRNRVAQFKADKRAEKLARKQARREGR